MFCGTAEFVCAPSKVRHIPVLLDEALEALASGHANRYLDCTFGGGGHTQALLESSEDAEVVSLDCDPDAGIRAKPLAEKYGERFRFCDLRFQCLDDASSEGEFDGVLFDLGISSFQLAEAEKGFSFRLDAPLDMRLNPREGQSAAGFLEAAPRESLVRAIREYGEERRWNRVVNAILEARGSGKLQRTVSAAEVVSKAIGNTGRKPRMHPATKTFQGIRIAINGELEAIAVALPKAFRALRPDGFLVVIAFHSLKTVSLSASCAEWQADPSIVVIPVLFTSGLPMRSSPQPRRLSPRLRRSTAIREADLLECGCSKRFHSLNSDG